MLCSLIFMTFFVLVWSVTPVPDKRMTDWLNAGGVPIAMAAQPMWFFGQSQNQPPCYPTWAIQRGKQTPGSEPCNFPNVGCNCRNPNIRIGNPGPDFPIYYTYNKCNNDEIRVAYHVFFEKDGFAFFGKGGHKYDWERVIVVWARGKDNYWRQSQLFMSRHRGYDKKKWGDIQNTFSSRDANKSRGGKNGQKNLDHPKVYVGWAKHAIFHDRNTGWNDPLSQLLDNEFRSQDWWHYHSQRSYIRADGSTKVGVQIGHLDWGEASSTPISTHERLCSV
ncbi:hypothetical protein FGRMN_5002 [Fusarium graminum]|nr:hypothetical protein FGRMN_5002 [Fusarium graminum]